MTTLSPPLALIRKHSLWGITLLASLLSVLYWGIIASDRYISEAHVIIQSTKMDTSQSLDLGSMISGMPSIGGGEQLLLRDYLLSVDMLKILDAKLDLRSHYSDRHRDLLSRMWRKDEPLEEFYDYYLTRVSIEYDDYAGVLVIQAQAYDAETAHAIATTLVDAGEAFMNQLAQRLAQEQVDFLNEEIQAIKADTFAARQELLNFQNKNNLVSPQATTENIAGVINGLEAKLTDLQTQRVAMLGYLMPNSANVTELNLQIGAVEQQIAREKARLTSTSTSGKTLNRVLEEYQRLEMNAEFSQDVYKTALAALEKGRFEASRTIKKMSVLQLPTYAEFPLEPRRFYNSFVSVLVILIVNGITHLLAAIIRDHKD